MKEFFRNLTRKQIVFGILAGISLLLFLILCIVSHSIKNSDGSQLMAERWSEEGGVAQVSCFISQNAQAEVNDIISFQHQLDSLLTEASVTLEEDNTNARLWVDAYSASGKINLEGSSGKMELNAIGVGGDFFLFHPLQLVNGSFFSGNDLMQDHVVIDEDAAWQLFGSNDVVGMQVTIAGIPHFVSGVIKRDAGKLQDAAGNGSSVAYVSHDTLKNYGVYNGINHYEIVMPNPVSGFAKKTLEENLSFGTDSSGNSLVEVVENSARFDLLPMFQVIADFGTRSMNGKAIIYPYWENVARGHEDILAVILILQLLFLLYPIIILVILIVLLWKHKSWTIKDIKNWFEDRLEKLRERRREKQSEYKKETGKSESAKKKFARWKRKEEGLENDEFELEDIE